MKANDKLRAVCNAITKLREVYISRAENPACSSEASTEASDRGVVAVWMDVSDKYLQPTLLLKSTDDSRLNAPKIDLSLSQQETMRMDEVAMNR